MLITLSGLSGCGKSTAAKLVATKLEVPTVDVGAIFRELAAKHKMDVVEFGKYAIANPKIDRELDTAMVKRARKQKKLILQGRLAGWMAYRHKLPAFKVWLEAKAAVRAKRIAGREKTAYGETLAKLMERDADNQRRYEMVYGLDLADLDIYDAVVRTDSSSPEQVAEDIINAYHIWQKKHSKPPTLAQKRPPGRPKKQPPLR